MVRRGSESERHVEFVSYSGRYPNLCSGTLVLRVDGKEAVFTDGVCGTEHFPSFWMSGGWVSGEHAVSDEWIISEDSLPEEYRKYADEIDRVFNSNVEHGCCGGCV